MKKTRFTETQIVKALKEYEWGRSSEALCRELEISLATFYNWKARYGGMKSSVVKRFKELEEEHARLKRMYAELSMDHNILKDVISKKAGVLPTKATDGADRIRIQSECEQGL